MNLFWAMALLISGNVFAAYETASKQLTAADIAIYKTIFQSKEPLHKLASATIPKYMSAITNPQGVPDSIFDRKVWVVISTDFTKLTADELREWGFGEKKIIEFMKKKFDKDYMGYQNAVKLRQAQEYKKRARFLESSPASLHRADIVRYLYGLRDGLVYNGKTLKIWRALVVKAFGDFVEY